MLWILAFLVRIYFPINRVWRWTKQNRDVYVNYDGFRRWNGWIIWDAGMGNNREMSTGFSKGLRERLSTWIALYRNKTQVTTSKAQWNYANVCSFNDYQVESRRSFTEKPAKWETVTENSRIIRVLQVALSNARSCVVYNTFNTKQHKGTDEEERLPLSPTKKEQKTEKKTFFPIICKLCFLSYITCHFANVERSKSAIWIFSSHVHVDYSVFSACPFLWKKNSLERDKGTQRERARREEYGEVVKKEECGVRRKEGRKKTFHKRNLRKYSSQNWLFSRCFTAKDLIIALFYPIACFLFNSHITRTLHVTMAILSLFPLFCWDRLGGRIGLVGIGITPGKRCGHGTLPTLLYFLKVCRC